MDFKKGLKIGVAFVLVNFLVGFIYGAAKELVRQFHAPKSEETPVENDKMPEE